MENMFWNDFWEPILLSIKVTVVSSILVFLLGVLAAWFMAKRSFYGKTMVETCLMLPLILPPTVVGFILLIILGRRSWIGGFIEWLFHQPVLFTWWAAVIASVVVAFPLVYQSAKVGFASVDKELEDTARCQGAKEWQVMLLITLPLAWRALVTGYILGFARGLGEFGATLMVAGNIPGRTQTIPTAIYLAVDTGHTALAWLWIAVTLIISFTMLWVAGRKT